MARAITVKVATAKVIKALETKLATMKADFEKQDANEAKYQKELEKYNKALIEFALANIKKATDFRTNHRAWVNQLNIDFNVDTTGKDFPAEPKREHEVIPAWQYSNMVDEITNALNILRMTDEEVVNASTMKSIAQYL
jgi:malate synthase